MSTQVVENTGTISLDWNEMSGVAEGNESITMTIKEEEQEGYNMDLKGESESDKDLIIYSLNESLQIHKEIVERIQNEKDDIEDQYELEKSIIQLEKLAIETETNENKQQLDKLEIIYKSLTGELEVKKVDYHKMETKFHSHIKSTQKQDLTVVYSQLNQMISQIKNLCVSTINKENVTHYLLNTCFINNSMIQQHFNSSLNAADTLFLIEKYIMDIIIQDIFKTTIHPGVSFNHSFGLIHDWIEKRNTSWANRLKQQLSLFVKQSNEQLVEIDLEKQIVQKKILDFLSHLYDNSHLLKENVISIINQASELNLILKSQENSIDILSIKQGTQFNDILMTSINTQENRVLFVISPPFVANGNDGFIIPAKVYCV